MPVSNVGFDHIPRQLAAGLASIRTEMAIPAEFPPDVVMAAEQAAAQPRLPQEDLTAIEFVTIDPPGAMDLDQALQLERDGEGFLVRYAIADVAAFVSRGDAVDTEAHRRGMTLYAPDHRTPLHPPALSEGAASLLPDQIRPALVWQIRLDAQGRMRDVEVARARVRSRAQLSYEQVQADLDAGQAPESLQLLKVIGELLQQLESERGGVSLNISEQHVNTEHDHWALEFRTPLPVEGWNAQISLLTGMAAAQMMLYGQVGVLRTLPPADHASLRKLRQTAKALAIAWPAEQDYPGFLRSLDPSRSDHAAMISACTLLFRGAGYQAFSGGVPYDVEHAALAAEYAHTTAPLRRLVDRYAGEVCVALCAGQPVPNWVLQALDALPDEMRAAEQRAKKYERAIINLVEACLLSNQVGDTFAGHIIEVDEDHKSGTLILAEAAVEAKIKGQALPLGQDVRARLVTADVTKGAVSFEMV